MMKDGRPAQLSDFREGDKLSTTIITSRPPRVMSEKEVQAIVHPPAAPVAAARAPSAAAPRPVAARPPTAAAAPVATPSAAPAAPVQTARMLPKTASSRPFFALASLLSLAMGLALTLRRRFVG
jgi:hypothetical protein